jgi:hypothetical protein
MERKNGEYQLIIVTRDRRENRACGFAKVLGTNSVFVDELWRVIKGLKMAKAHDIFGLEVQVDSRAVLQCLTSGRNCSITGRRLVQQIRSVKHWKTYRGAIQVCIHRSKQSSRLFSSWHYFV